MFVVLLSLRLLLSVSTFHRNAILFSPPVYESKIRVHEGVMSSANLTFFVDWTRTGVCFSVAYVLLLPVVRGHQASTNLSINSRRTSVAYACEADQVDRRSSAKTFWARVHLRVQVSLSVFLFFFLLFHHLLVPRRSRLSCFFVFFALFPSLHLLLFFFVFCILYSCV